MRPPTLPWLKHFKNCAKTIGSETASDPWWSRITPHTRSNQFLWEIRYYLLGLPPHLTYVLQSLDVVVFQSLKHYHAKALDLMTRHSVMNISKLKCLSCIQRVKDKHSRLLLSTLSSGKREFTHLTNNMWLNYCLQGYIFEPHHDLLRTIISPTLRQINKVTVNLGNALETDESLDIGVAYNLAYFIRGSLIAARPREIFNMR